MTCTARMKAAELELPPGRSLRGWKRLPATRGFWRRVTLLSLGGFFEFYDLFLAAYVAPGLVKSGILTTTTPGLFGTSGIAGFVAAFLRWACLSAPPCSALSPTGWAAHHLHRLAALVCRRLAGDGVPAGCLQPESVALHLRHRHRRRAGHHRHLYRRTGAAGVCAAGPLPMPTSSSSPPFRWWRSWAGCWCRGRSFGLDGWRFVVMAGSVGAVLVWFVRRAPAGKPALAGGNMAASQEADAIVEAWEVEARLEGAAAARAQAAADEQKRGSFWEIWRRPIAAAP